jgi:spermidine synthase
LKKISFLEKCLSFLKPIVLDSFVFEDIEYIIALYKNNILLNTKNANQSNGSLYLAFKLLLDNFINFPKDKNLNILILGYGLGSVDRIITNKNKNIKITGVEKNIFLKPWMYAYEKPNNSEVFFEDAIQFVNNIKDSYDIVIIDLFEDTNIPDSIHQFHFWDKIYNSINQDGLIIWNVLQKKYDLNVIKGFIFDKKINIITGNLFLLKRKNEI